MGQSSLMSTYQKSQQVNKIKKGLVLHVSFPFKKVHQSQIQLFYLPINAQHTTFTKISAVKITSFPLSSPIFSTHFSNTKKSNQINQKNEEGRSSTWYGSHIPYITRTIEPKTIIVSHT